ncbi:MAG: hypothetical protein HY589_01640, partial [Candidatus Omnitrophica bacterium]|nr:hypothetical protein [Candidatus Omnitrophota bacterium]
MDWISYFQEMIAERKHEFLNEIIDARSQWGLVNNNGSWPNLVQADRGLEACELGEISRMSNLSLDQVLRPAAYAQRDLYSNIQALMDNDREPEEHNAALAALKEYPDKEALRVILMEAVREVSRVRLPGNWEKIGSYIFQTNRPFIEHYLSATEHIFLRRLLAGYLARLNRDIKMGRRYAGQARERLLRLAETMPAPQDILIQNLRLLGAAPDAIYATSSITGQGTHTIAKNDEGYRLFAEYIAVAAPDLLVSVREEAGTALYGYVIEALCVLFNDRERPVGQDEVARGKAYLKKVILELSGQKAGSDYALLEPAVAPGILMARLDRPAESFAGLFRGLSGRDPSHRSYSNFEGGYSYLVQAELRLRQVARLLECEPDVEEGGNGYYKLYVHMDMIKRGSIVAGHFHYSLDASGRKKIRLTTIAERQELRSAFFQRRPSSEIQPANIQRAVSACKKFYDERGRLPTLGELAECASLSSGNLVSVWGKKFYKALRSAGVPAIGNSWKEIQTASRDVDAADLKAIAVMDTDMDWYITRSRTGISVGSKILNHFSAYLDTLEQSLGKKSVMLGLKRDAKSRKIECYVFYREEEEIKQQRLDNIIRLTKRGEIEGVKNTKSVAIEEAFKAQENNSSVNI